MAPTHRRWLDRWLFRWVFTGASARRYRRHARPAFGALDQRLAARWAPDLATAAVIIDVGAGPGTVGITLRQIVPAALVIDVEPSPDYPAVGPRLRARAEALPLADATVDAAVSVSAIRHVGDRRAALAELRRVVRPGRPAWIVELDPEAPAAKIRAHADRLGTRWLRASFGPLVVRTAPPAATIAADARAAGWAQLDHAVDAEQPVYLLRLA
ncbi:MAG: class I SAM-dependent methyltransferase [Kofleriaceae bacterium]